MKLDISDARTAQVQAQIRLLEMAASGQLDGLPCPRCQNQSVSVSFTRRSENDYWTWLTCGHCGFQFRAQSDKPPHYSPGREHTVEQSAKE